MLEQTIERWFDEATDKGLQKGLEKGLLKGLEKGRQEGLARAVGLQLQLRFGAVPQRVQAGLSSATEEQLLQWAGAILTAGSLQDLFGPDDGVCASAFSVCLNHSNPGCCFFGDKTPV